VDRGPGLSEHALAHAFDPFFSEKPAGRQPGLGLTKARRLVEAHHGKLTLENGPNGGAVATIRLDVRSAGSMRGVA
jgi:signal transduction histidine kinase